MKKIFTLILFVFTANTYAQQCAKNTHSMNFDGASSHITLPKNSVLEIKNAITVEAWINASLWAPNVWENSIVSKDGWSSGERGYSLRAGANGMLSFNIAGVSPAGLNVSWQEVTSNPLDLMNANSWYHVAGTFDGDTLKTFINGVLKGTTLFHGTIDTLLNYRLNIGKLSDSLQFSQTRYFNGKIDEVKIYNRELSSTELLASMFHQINVAGQNGLVAYWLLNDSTNSVAIDESNNHLNGAIHTTTLDTLVPFTEGYAVNAPVVTQNGLQLSITPTTNTKQWYKNNSILAGATGNTYNATQNGSYTVKVTNSFGCSAISGGIVISNVSVNDVEENELAKAYPNPFENELFISLVSENNFIEILNMTGKIVYQNNMKTNTTKIDTEKLNKGIYFLKISTNKRSITKKIVKY